MSESGLFPTGKDSKMLLDLGKRNNKVDKIQEVKPVAEMATTPEATPTTDKRKSNRGRRRKYQPGEVIKFTYLIESRLIDTLKVLIKDEKKTIQEVIVPYMNEWLESPYDIESSGQKERKTTGFNLEPLLRKQFSNECFDQGYTQTEVMEEIYRRAISDFMKR